MKITNNYNVTNTKSFKGYIPYSFLNDLRKQNTQLSKQALESCLAHNAVLRGSNNVNLEYLYKQLFEKFGMKCDFEGDKFVGTCVALTANIMHKLGFKLPPGVYFKDLSRTDYASNLGICCTKKYDYSISQKFRADFPFKSVVLNSWHDWDDIQYNMIEGKRVNHFPTPHFLDVIIHEFVHAAHITDLVDKFGEKEGIKIMGQFVKKISNKQTAQMIKNESTTYAATTPAEMVADEYTELIVNSLNPKTLLPDKMRFEMLRKKEPFLFDKLLDACWKGDVEFVNKHRKNESLIKKWLEKRYRPV